MVSVSGLEIVFDWSFDGGAWPGPSDNSFGEAWLGPQGLLGRLELELGLAARHATPLERAVALTRALGQGYWSASFEVDPIATARRLLDDRDALVSWGWRGESASARLSALWAATTSAPLGIPDRVLRVTDQLARGHIDIATIALVDPIACNSPIWQRMFEAMQRRGVRIVHRPPAFPETIGDLGTARSSGFRPTGDGTLQLLRTHGALAAANEVAAVLAAAADDASTLVIGADAVLDAAFVRHGVPRVGADVPAPGSAGLLRACIESAFQPADAADVYDLICADPGPVPRNVAWGLAGVLRKFAGRGSDAWREALAAQLAVIDASTREAVAARLAALLGPIASRDGVVEMPAFEARMHVLAAWARGRGLDELALRSVQLLELLGGTNRVSRPQLVRLCDELERTTVPGPTAELGLHSVIVPGAMAGPARTVIWWGFTRDRAPAAPRIQLSNAERAALGAIAPDFGTLMAHEARRWRRPLELTTGTLVLVCPRADAVGDRAHPHPLWDELVAAMPESTLRACLVVDHLVLSGGTRVRRQRALPRPLPRPFGVAYLPAPLGLRVEESASSLEQLLGCSLSYMLRYHGKLRPRLAGTPAQPNPLLYGNVAHHVLALVFSVGALTSERAAARAEAVLDAELPRIAETLLLPDHQAERSMLRRAVIECARLVATVIERSGGNLRGVEVPLAGMVGTARVVGRADLVIEAPEHLLDFKWGTSSHREALRTGTAVQLAIYAALLHEHAGAGFLGIRDQRLLAARGSRIPLATEPGDHSVEKMLAAVRGALEGRIGELAEGRAVAPGALEVAQRSRVVDGMLRLAPDCDHCELGTLCGRRGRA